MAIEPTDPLERARDLVRDTEPPSEAWEELSTSIMTKVREMVRPSYPIRAFAGDPGDPGDPGDEDRTYVSSRVVVTTLRRSLQGSTSYAPTDIKVDVDDERLLGVRLGLACSYGLDLVALGERVREQAAGLVVDLLGLDAATAAGLVEVVIEDVVEGDPNIV